MLLKYFSHLWNEKNEFTQRGQELVAARGSPQPNVDENVDPRLLGRQLTQYHTHLNIHAYSGNHQRKDCQLISNNNQVQEL